MNQIFKDTVLVEKQGQVIVCSIYGLGRGI